MSVKSNAEADVRPAAGNGRPRQPFKATPPRRAAGVLLIAAAFAAVLLPGSSRRAGAQVPLKCNGAEYLCDRRYDEVTYATTHNSFSKNTNIVHTPNQFRSVKRQLEVGIRGLMLDIYYEDDETRLCHEICDPAFGYMTFWKERQPGDDPDDVIILEDIRTFLAENPNEVVTIIFETYATPQQIAGAFEGAGMIQNLFAYNKDEGWPTLRQMIERNQRLVVFSGDKRMVGEYGPLSPNGAHKDYPWLHYEFALASETGYEWHDINSIGRGKPKYCEQNRPENAPDPGLFILNHFLTNPILVHRANAMNSFDFVVDSSVYCREQRAKWPNFVAVDWENCDSQVSRECVRGSNEGHDAVSDIVTASARLNEYRLIRPADITVDAEPGQCAARVDFPALSIAAQVTTSHSSGSFFPAGTTTVTATSEFGDTISFNVTVQDRENPTLSLSVGRSTLWSPNKEMVDVALSADASDNCGTTAPVEVTVFSDEGDAQDSNFSPDAAQAVPGQLRLRAERAAGGDGRVYLIVAKTRDQAGNQVVSATTVVVPHDKASSSGLLVNTQATSALNYFKAHGAPPPGYFLVGDGPVTGPQQ